MSRKSKSARRSPVVRYLLVLAALALVAAGFYFGFQAAQPPPPPDFVALRSTDSADGERRVGESTRRASTRRTEPSTPPSPPNDDGATGETSADGTGEAAPGLPTQILRQAPPGSGGTGPRIALVIDDLGRSLDDLDTLRALGVPITYAVLPFEVKTGPVVEELRRRQEEVFLHLPMEAKGGADPGPGALFLSMSEAEMRQAVESAITAVPGAVGVNNHMGSAIVSDPTAMGTVVDVLAGHRLAFLDSRTDVDTLGYTLARGRGLPAAERQVFLDTFRDPEFIRGQFQELLTAARERGGAIAIGHPYPETLAILAEQVPAARAEGYEFVAARELFDG